MTHVRRIKPWVLAAILIGSATLWSCTSAASFSADNDEPISVTLGHETKKARVDLPVGRFSIGLEEIVDSRCPANAKCIWAGELAARIDVERVDQPGEKREITLGPDTVPSIELFGVKLELQTIDETSVTFTIEAAEQR